MALFPSMWNELPLNVTGDDTISGAVAGVFVTAAYTTSASVWVAPFEDPTDLISQVLEFTGNTQTV